ncbi:hypothetical protein B1778_00750 [Dehalococcoides mccartyi]|uniref:hypothetical protein n=1 Tax=Dehalococcoides mccartyi TaxID=61435 RepID=UPI0009900590|nr:hypothetical protein [Dehalococcoides mccartyi]AQU05301.1 hypothetical protein B1777_00895 [Dehalococcoides mccartyi]AQU06754.1 hypothetical protein B1778_00750 [Dehalococcoides mccartyi]
MPCAFVPPEYRAVLIGQAQNIADLGTFSPLEDSAEEGALVLVRLDFAEEVSEEVLGSIEQSCRDAGIEPYPGSPYYVYADTASNSVYMVWQKGMPWLPIIIGLLATVVLPPLLTAGIWLILPDSLKSLISSLVNMGMMLVMMWLLTSLMKPLLTPAREKQKQVKEAGE